LNAIVAAVPVRLMKRDLLFIAEGLLPLLDERKLPVAARNRGIKAKEGESTDKLMAAFLRKADEGALGRFMVEAVILLALRSQSDGGKALRAAAQTYKVDTDAIVLKVKHEFAAKEKAKRETKVQPKPVKANTKKVA
jgi:ParB family chromosome partitioning protein